MNGAAEAIIAGGWPSIATAIILLIMSVLSLAGIATQVIGLQPIGEGSPAREKIARAVDQHGFKRGKPSRALAGVIAEEAGLSSPISPLLASIGVNAPYIGLLGTVMGIYSALTSLGSAKGLTVQDISIPVGEALAMTALGLLVAIPAVFGFNYSQVVRRRRHARLEAYAFTLAAKPCPASQRIVADANRHVHLARPIGEKS